MKANMYNLLPYEHMYLSFSGTYFTLFHFHYGFKLQLSVL